MRKESIFGSIKLVASSTASIVVNSAELLNNELLTAKVSNSISNVDEILDSKSSVLNKLYDQLDSLTVVNGVSVDLTGLTERQTSQLEDVRKSIAIIRGINISQVIGR